MLKIIGHPVTITFWGAAALISIGAVVAIAFYSLPRGYLIGACCSTVFTGALFITSCIYQVKYSSTKGMNNLQPRKNESVNGFQASKGKKNSPHFKKNKSGVETRVEKKQVKISKETITSISECILNVNKKNSEGGFAFPLLHIMKEYEFLKVKYNENLLKNLKVELDLRKFFEKLISFNQVALFFFRKNQQETMSEMIKLTNSMNIKAFDSKDKEIIKEFNEKLLNAPSSTTNELLCEFMALNLLFRVVPEVSSEVVLD